MKILKKIYYSLAFILFYLGKLLQANFIIAMDILTPKMKGNPRFMDVPVIVKSDLGLLLFSNLLSMTPGTLSMDISEDKKTIMVHVLYFSTEERLMNDFNQMQKKIQRITG